MYIKDFIIGLELIIGLRRTSGLYIFDSLYNLGGRDFIESIL